ncbi:hypothetical protein EWB00_004297 [Schistosoma japonicum]|uniref:Uncharacterized protein n=1 Tax=Schistosoma japonicum TaxID=6182 RepID=A0A4Z2D5P6_SCHJA|nr:hypothetical protein EWB00_004297 [Schistosoma japonicum]
MYLSIKMAWNETAFLSIRYSYFTLLVILYIQRLEAWFMLTENMLVKNTGVLNHDFGKTLVSYTEMRVTFYTVN